MKWHCIGETHPTRASVSLKLTKYSQWKLSGWLVWGLGRLEWTVSRGQFGLVGK